MLGVQQMAPSMPLSNCFFCRPLCCEWRTGRRHKPHRFVNFWGFAFQRHRGAAVPLAVPRKSRRPVSQGMGCGQPIDPLFARIAR